MVAPPFVIFTIKLNVQSPKAGSKKLCLFLLSYIPIDIRRHQLPHQMADTLSLVVNKIIGYILLDFLSQDFQSFSKFNSMKRGYI
jgi:hypothetical protein